MSVFDKLKAYSRKPAAVILATVMATSTIPTTPIAQAVTAAYAEEGQSAKSASAASKGEVYGRFDKSGTVSLGFDAHPAKGTDGTARCTISKKELTDWFVGKLKTEILKDKTGSYEAVVSDATAKAQAAHPGATISDVMITDITDVVAGNPTSDNSGVAVEMKDGNLTVSSATACSAKINVPVASVKYKFTYFYVDQATKEPEKDNGNNASDGSDESSKPDNENKKLLRNLDSRFLRLLPIKMGSTFLLTARAIHSMLTLSISGPTLSRICPIRLSRGSFIRAKLNPYLLLRAM